MSIKASNVKYSSWELSTTTVVICLFDRYDNIEDFVSNDNDDMQLSIKISLGYLAKEFAIDNRCFWATEKL